MPATSNAATAVDFAAATSLALELDFDGAQPQHFGAPAARSTPFCTGSFEGDVARGASCNCSSITLIPHCNGTHTESVGHLTTGFRPLHDFVPLAPIPALLLTVDVVSAADTTEDTLPAPQTGRSTHHARRVAAALARRHADSRRARCCCARQLPALAPLPG